MPSVFAGNRPTSSRINGLGEHELAATTHVVRVIRQRLERAARELAARSADPLQSRHSEGE